LKGEGHSNQLSSLMDNKNPSIVASATYRPQVAS
jgi:hypothetical protein